jgi:hypothetical protein
MNRRNLIWLALVAAALLMTCWLSAANAATPTVGHGTAVVVSKPVSGDLPATLTGPSEMVVGTFSIFTLDADATSVKWKLLSAIPASDFTFMGFQTYHGMSNGKPITKDIAFFQPRKAGVYHVVAVPVKDDQSALLTLDVKVTGTNPEPNPDPDPTPPPVPGKRLIVVIQETGDADPKAQIAMTRKGLERWAAQAGHVYRWTDPDVKTSSGQTPAWFQPIKTAIGNTALPVLVVAESSDAGAGKILAVEKLPTTSAEAIAIVQSHGG